MVYPKWQTVLISEVQSLLKTTGTDQYNYNVVYQFLLKVYYIFHSYLDLDIVTLLRVEASDHILVSLTIHLGRGINFSKEFIIQIDSTRLKQHSFLKSCIQRKGFLN